MAKLIFTSCYIRDAPPEHLQNYVRYISPRVEWLGEQGAFYMLEMIRLTAYNYNR